MGSKRGYPNNPKVHIMDKKIPFTLSVSRRCRLAFEGLCDEMGVDVNLMAEEALMGLVRELKKE